MSILSNYIKIPTKHPLLNVKILYLERVSVKLQISYDVPILSEALELAKATAHVADVLELGTSLLFAEGVAAIKAFKQEFGDKIIMADAKLINNIYTTLPLFVSLVNYTSVLAGAANSNIKHATTLAHEHRSKIVLDLIDSASPGQSALDATTLEVDLILFRRNHELKSYDELFEQWQSVRGNTTLPIFVEGKIDRQTVTQVIDLKPHGIVIGSAITKSSNPVQEAFYFRQLLDA